MVRIAKSIDTRVVITFVDGELSFVRVRFASGEETILHLPNYLRHAIVQAARCHQVSNVSGIVGWALVLDKVMTCRSSYHRWSVHVP